MLHLVFLVGFLQAGIIISLKSTSKGRLNSAPGCIRSPTRRRKLALNDEIKFMFQIFGLRCIKRKGLLHPNSDHEASSQARAVAIR